MFIIVFVLNSPFFLQKNCCFLKGNLMRRTRLLFLFLGGSCSYRVMLLDVRLTNYASFLMPSSNFTIQSLQQTKIEAQNCQTPLPYYFSFYHVTILLCGTWGGSEIILLATGCSHFNSLPIFCVVLWCSYNYSNFLFCT